MSFPIPSYQVGDRPYNHRIADTVTIDSISLTPQKQLRYLYTLDSGATGEACEADFADPPSAEDVADVLYINSCSLQEILASFPNLPGGKKMLARKIIQARDEVPFDNEISFINRMLEIEPKVEWEAISHKLKYDMPEQIGV
jgi:hypothetical protein